MSSTVLYDATKMVSRVKSSDAIDVAWCRVHHVTPYSQSSSEHGRRTKQAENTGDAQHRRGRRGSESRLTWTPPGCVIQTRLQVYFQPSDLHGQERQLPSGLQPPEQEIDLDESDLAPENSETKASHGEPKRSPEQPT